MTGLYIHIPFCRRRCLYCDFFTVGERLADWPVYVDAILAEARFRRVPVNEYTLYIGGGTPSLMPPEEFNRLANGIQQLYGTPVEFTIEVNPDDVTPQLARVWKQAGVSRVSMGVQSLVDDELKAIGRRHDSATAINAYQILRSQFENISLDLMFGLPGQSLDSFDCSINGVLELRPEHISAYSLMYEERSALTKLRDMGRIEETDEDDSCAMFELLSHRLKEAGYEQYEISNYALGSENRSRHNSLYWAGAPYIGLGPGAHGYDGQRLRTHNVQDIKHYIDFWNSSQGQVNVPEPSQGQANVPEHVAQTEILTDSDLREEMVMTRLRTREGLDLAEFKSKFGALCYEALLKSAFPHLRAGKLEILSDEPEGHYLALTHKGIFISDDIISSLF